MRYFGSVKFKKAPIRTAWAALFTANPRQSARSG